MRSRAYRIDAHVRIDDPAADGVLVAHGQRVLGIRMDLGPFIRILLPVMGMTVLPSKRVATLLVDDAPAGSLDMGRVGLNSQVSFSGLDIGLDRGSPVSHYASPYVLRDAKLYRVEFTLDPQQELDYDQ